MKILKKIVVFLLLVNAIIIPINIYFAIKYAKVIINKDKYELINVQITKIKDITPSGGMSGSYPFTLLVEYQFNKQELTTENITLTENTKEFKHFSQLRAKGDFYEAFGEKTIPVVGESIWVWHNPNAENHYALGENDKFNLNKYHLKLIIFIFLIVLAIFSILWELNYRKTRRKPKTRLEESNKIIEKTSKSKDSELKAEQIEAKFTQADIIKIKSKRGQSNVAFIFAFIMFGAIIYFKNDSLNLFLKIIFYACLAITSFAVFDIFFGDNSSKDLKNKIKIVTKITVLDKNINTSDGASETTHYELDFGGVSDIKHYEVKRRIFDKIKVGDIIDIEYSKESCWILKIELNSLDIENKDYVK